MTKEQQDKRYMEINKSLLCSVVAHSSALGETFIGAGLSSSEPLIAWINYLCESLSADQTKPLLYGVYGTIIEILACLAMGLSRPAMFSMRTEIELLHAWMYFNDHLIEWDYAKTTGERYPMLAQTRKYLSNYNRRFENRYRLLMKRKKRTTEDPYALLSVHVHAVTMAAMPRVVDVSTVVQGEDRCKECVAMQGEVAEYLSDTLLAWYASRWADLPVDIVESVRHRLSDKETADFFR